MSADNDATGSVETALAHAARLLEQEPALALEQAEEIVRAVGPHPPALLLIATALRQTGNMDNALAHIERLVAQQPRWAAAHLEHALVLGALRRGHDAVEALRRALALRDDLPEAWRALGDHLSAIGDSDGAQDAYARQVRAATHDPRLIEAATAMLEERIPAAEALLKEQLRRAPTDVAALRMLAEVAMRLGRLEDAEALLARCLELAPAFATARHNYAQLLTRDNRPLQALAQVEHLLRDDAANPGHRNLHAIVLGQIGEFERAIGIFAALLTEYPRHAKIWMSYGHALKTAGRTAQSIEAYRRCIELDASCGEAWWSLANLKTFRFTDEDIAAMRAQIARNDLAVEMRFHFDFALGKALEDRADWRDSFHHYREANRLRRTLIEHDADAIAEGTSRTMRLFTREFFTARAAHGSMARDPIFVVGLPRSGSTLVEQILASHSAVEGTMELAEITTLSRTLRKRVAQLSGATWQDAANALSADEARALGEQYLASTRVQRHSAAPHFIDKMPNNFLIIGLDSIDYAECAHHRRPATSLVLLLQRIQAAFRARSAFQLRPARAGSLLSRLCAPDGAFRCRAAGAYSSRLLREHGRRHGSPSATAARLLCAAVRTRLPALLRKRTRRAHRELGAGTPTHLSRWARAVDALSRVAGSAGGCAGAGSRLLSRCAGRFNSARCCSNLAP